MRFAGDKKNASLLVGDARQAFWDASEIDEQRVTQCADLMDAVNAAADGHFGSIYVVMSSFNGNLESAVDTLRQVGKNSNLVLLALMYEEPVARQMIRSARRPGNPADNYYICPMDAKSLLAPVPFVEPVAEQIIEEQAQVGTAAEEIEITEPTSRQVQDARVRELETLATEDDLTGLKNRRYVREFLRQILLRAQAEGFNTTLLIFDIDDFKHYNDAYGHKVGDNVLVQAATMMKRCWREHDVVARIGGDEFAVVFWDRPDKLSGDQDTAERERRNIEPREHPQEAMFIAERFRSEMNATDLCLLGTDGKGSLTISGGLASFPRDGSGVDELFEKADQAMLEAKRSGKNQIYLVGTEG